MRVALVPAHAWAAARHGACMMQQRRPAAREPTSVFSSASSGFHSVSAPSAAANMRTVAIVLSMLEAPRLKLSLRAGGAVTRHVGMWTKHLECPAAHALLCTSRCLPKFGKIEAAAAAAATATATAAACDGWQAKHTTLVGRVEDSCSSRGEAGLLRPGGLFADCHTAASNSPPTNPARAAMAAPLQRCTAQRWPLLTAAAAATAAAALFRALLSCCKGIFLALESVLQCLACCVLPAGNRPKPANR